MQQNVLQKNLTSTNVHVDEMKTYAKESHLFLKRCVQTYSSKVKIAQNYVCLGSNFTINGWTLKQLIEQIMTLMR